MKDCQEVFDHEKFQKQTDMKFKSILSHITMEDGQILTVQVFEDYTAYPIGEPKGKYQFHHQSKTWTYINSMGKEYPHEGPAYTVLNNALTDALNSLKPKYTVKPS